MNSVTLIGRAVAQVTELTFVLEVDGIGVPVEYAKPPKPGEHVAVEGALRAGERSLYVEGRRRSTSSGRHMA